MSSETEAPKVRVKGRCVPNKVGHFFRCGIKWEPEASEHEVTPEQADILEAEAAIVVVRVNADGSSMPLGVEPSDDELRALVELARKRGLVDAAPVPSAPATGEPEAAPAPAAPASKKK
jgi:hypothetical protein